MMNESFVNRELNFEEENLPKGWIKVILDKIIEPSKEKFEPQNSENRIFLGLEHIKANSGKILGKGNSINTKSTKTVFNKGDILYGKLRPYLNKVCVPIFDGVCSTDILVFSKNRYRSSKYIAYFLLQSKFVKFANLNSTGVQHPRIKFDVMSQFQISLPPLNEQKRIVQKIESIFSQIDAGKENLEVLASHVKSSSGSLNVLKASVLKQAFEGRLVPQDHNDESAEILLKKIHGDSKIEFKGENLLKGWVITNINKVCITKSGGTPSRKNSEYFGGTIPWIKSGELNDSIITSCEESITKLGLEQSNASLYPKNTILMAMYGATIGKLAILGFSASTNQAICALSHNEKILIDMYLFLFLKSIRNDLIGIGFGGAQKNISQEKIKNILIPIPPLPEQRRIVSKIESIFDKIDAIENGVILTVQIIFRIKFTILFILFIMILHHEFGNTEKNIHSHHNSR